MATVIDSLVVTLGLDTKNFTAGQRQAIQQLQKFEQESSRSTKRGEESAQRQLNFLSKIRNEAVGLVGALAGAYGIKQFVTSIVSGDAAVSRFSRTTKIAATDIAAFETALRLAGAPAGAGITALDTFTNLLQQYKQNLPGGAKLIEFYGRLSKASGGVIIDPEAPALEQFRKITEAINKIEKVAPGSGASILQQYGFSQDLAAALLKGVDAMDALIARARHLNNFTDKSAADAERMQAAFVAISKLIEGFGRSAINATGPEALSSYERGLDAFKKNPSAAKIAIGALMLPFAPFIWDIMENEDTLPTPGVTPGIGTRRTGRYPGVGSPTKVYSSIDPPPAYTGWNFPVPKIGDRYGGGNSTSNTINVNGPITVTTQATDANGVARDLRGALQAESARGLASQANGGAQ